MRQWFLLAGALALLAAGVVAVAVGTGGGGGGVPATSCGPIHQDPFDPRSVLHLLPGAPVPPYVTDPPTSGAHQVGYYPRGVDPNAIPEPIQVALLEVGFVLIQYRPAPGALVALAPLTSVNPYVTLAPNPTLPNPVVATSWLHDRRCGDSSPKAVEDLRRFVLAWVNHGSQPEIPLAETAPGGVRPANP